MGASILVTGGAGFIGSNFIRYFLAAEPEVHLVNLDKLTYAGNLENLKDLEDNPRYTFVHGDIGDPQRVDEVFQKFQIQHVFHFAAESHVDRSILDPQAFIRTNIEGTYVLLQVARKHWQNREDCRFIHVSTDEVYGSLGPEGYFHEETPYAPNSPYAASKAASDHLVRAYWKTYGLPAIITNCCNNYGPYQFPEKLIPLMIRNALADKPLPIYGDGQQVRDWIYVEDHCRALHLIWQKGGLGETYCIGARCERTNLEVVKEILKLLKKPESLITFVEDRPGHDRRYAILPAKLESLGFRPEVSFEEGLERTIQWYLDHQDWLDRVTSGEYMKYYETQYGSRLEGEKS